MFILLEKNLLPTIFKFNIFQARIKLQYFHKGIILSSLLLLVQQAQPYFARLSMRGMLRILLVDASWSI